jgi:2-oxoglutarate/2-oxoacid ferredoxin oxidoreductase subunit beta
MSTVKEFNPKEQPQWCPGCGNFGIIMALRSALSKTERNTHETVVVSGIGCSGKSSHYIRSYGFESLHGRVLPVATGVKLSNKKLTVIGMGGDGDGYGIGLNHFIHLCRRNLDITYIVHNNSIYGLTTGQVSPVSMKGMKTKSTPHGVIEQPIHQLALAITSDATFVARAYAGNLAQLSDIFQQAINHKGIAIVDVLQECPSWNKVNTKEWIQQRVYDLNAEGHDITNREAAYKKAMEDVESKYEKIPTGIFYKVDKPTYGDELPQIKDKELVEQNLESIDLTKTLKAHI